MAALDCLDTLVGLSKTDYACFTDDTPAGYDTSDSGYHLTDTDYGLTVMEQCALDGWTLLQSALDQAISETKTDLRARIREQYDSSIKPFAGTVGKLKFTASGSVAKDYIGIRIRVKKQIKGAKFVFKKIYVGLNTSGDVDVSVKSNDPLFSEPDAVTVTAVANQFASAASSIELPLWSYSDLDADYLEYYISIPRGSAQPLNNTLSCCGNTPAWMDYFKAEGMAADDQSGNGGLFGNAAHGFVLDGFLICEELDWICELEELNGYHLRDVLARTLQFRGAAIAISALIDTLQVNPCNGYQLENLNSRRTYLNQRYADNIAWIAANIPAGISGCFTCKPQAKFSRAKMIV